MQVLLKSATATCQTDMTKKKLKMINTYVFVSHVGGCCLYDHDSALFDSACGYRRGAKFRPQVAMVRGWVEIMAVSLALLPVDGLVLVLWLGRGSTAKFVGLCALPLALTSQNFTQTETPPRLSHGLLEQYLEVARALVWLNGWLCKRWVDCQAFQRLQIQAWLPLVLAASYSLICLHHRRTPCCFLKVFWCFFLPVRYPIWVYSKF